MSQSATVQKRETMSKAEKLAKQFTNLGIDDFREFQRILDERGFQVWLAIVPDSGRQPPTPDPEQKNNDEPAWVWLCEECRCVNQLNFDKCDCGEPRPTIIQRL